MPGGQRQRGVGDEVRGAVHIRAVIAAAEEGVGDFGHAAVQREMPGQRQRELGLVAVGAAGAFELEAAIVGDVDLLVGVIDQEGVGAEAQAAEVGSGAELVEVGGGEARLIGALDHAARVDAVDAAAVVQMQGERHRPRGREHGRTLALPASGRVGAFLRGLEQVADAIAEFVVTQTARKQQAPAPQAQALLKIAGGIANVREGPRGDAAGCAAVARVEADIDLVIVEVGAEREHRGDSRQLVHVDVLRVGAFLQARIVLLEGIAVDRVVQIVT